MYHVPKLMNTDVADNTINLIDQRWSMFQVYSLSFPVINVTTSVFTESAATTAQYYSCQKIGRLKWVFDSITWAQGERRPWESASLFITLVSVILQTPTAKLLSTFRYLQTNVAPCSPDQFRVSTMCNWMWVGQWNIESLNLRSFQPRFRNSSYSVRPRTGYCGGKSIAGEFLDRSVVVPNATDYKTTIFRVWFTSGCDRIIKYYTVGWQSRIYRLVQSWSTMRFSDTIDDSGATVSLRGSYRRLS